MKKKQSIKFLDVKGKDSVVHVSNSTKLIGDIFQYQGASYIVGPQRQIGNLFDIELKRIKGVTGMHIHQFYHGICFLCGIYDERRDNGS